MTRLTDDERAAIRERAAAVSAPGHFVRVRPFDWGLVHPLACRPNLTACSVHEACVEVGEPGVPAGFYRVTLDADGVLEYEPTPEPDGDALIQLPADVLALDAEVDALRAERDTERVCFDDSRSSMQAQIDAAVARAEQAEARLKELERSFGPDHVVEIGPGDWTMQHPLACRPNLLACRFNAAMHRTFPEPGRLEPGRYVALLDEGGFVVLRRALSGEEGP